MDGQNPARPHASPTEKVWYQGFGFRVVSIASIPTETLRRAVPQPRGDAGAEFSYAEPPHHCLPGRLPTAR